MFNEAEVIIGRLENKAGRFNDDELYPDEKSGVTRDRISPEHAGLRINPLLKNVTICSPVWWLPQKDYL